MNIEKKIEDLGEKLRKLDVGEAVRESWDVTKYKKLVEEMEEDEDEKRKLEIYEKLYEMDLELLQNIEKRLPGYFCIFFDTQEYSWENLGIAIYCTREEALSISAIDAGGSLAGIYIEDWFTTTKIFLAEEEEEAYEWDNLQAPIRTT